MWQEIGKRFAALLTVKTIVTVITTIVFATMALRGALSSEFMTVFTMIIGFYFGTQHEQDKGGTKK